MNLNKRQCELYNIINGFYNRDDNYTMSPKEMVTVLGILINKYKNIK